MLRAAVELTQDLAAARGAIYWPDLLASVALGYGGIAGLIAADNAWAAAACAIVAVLALYRAMAFIHELTHLHRDALPGFRTTWNLLVGIPLLSPSFMYEGIHTLHHARTRYGTIGDPEYLPLARMHPWTLPLFALSALLVLPFFMIRSGLLVPLGAAIPPLRQLVWSRMSSLAINPAFRRARAEGAFARAVAWQEAGATLWAWALAGSVLAYGWRPLLIALAVASTAVLLNQIRTLVAHLWENDGGAITVTAQYLDSANVPPPGVLACLWAPVGLRYHALHHLLPSLPYHALGEANRRLSVRFGPGSTYAMASYPGLAPLLGRLVQCTMRRR